MFPTSLKQGRSFCLQLCQEYTAYLAAYCQLVSDEGRRQLRSVTSRTCVVRRTYSNYGDRCFAAAGPKLWNSLPADLRQADISFQRFKRLLKTFCSSAEIVAHVTKMLKPRLISFLTYLLTLQQINTAPTAPATGAVWSCPLHCSGRRKLSRR